MKRSFQKKFFILLPIILFVSMLLSVAYFKDLNNLILDRLQGGEQTREEIVLIEIDDRSLEEIGAWPWNRDVFGKAIDNLQGKNVSVLGIDVLFLESRDGDSSLQSSIESSDFPIVLGSKIIENKELKPVFESKNLKIGFTNFLPDLDGKIRSTDFLSEINESCSKSLSFSISETYFKKNYSFENGCLENIKLGRNDVGIKNLKFDYTDSKFTRYNFSDLYSRKLENIDLKDKIILIGSTVTDLKNEISDSFPGINGDSTPGVVIHANIINSVLENSFRTDFSQNQLILSIFSSIFILSILFFSIKSTKWNSIMFFSTFLTLNLFGVFIFELGLNWPFLQFNSALIFSFVSSLGVKYSAKRREVSFVKSAFTQYVNQDLLNQLIQNPKTLKLGGEKKEVTILFSDIRGFTTISEQIEAENLITLINAFLEKMSQVILQNNGTIDKFIGDAIMSFWNAPLEDKLHRKNAVVSSLEMIKNLKKFNDLENDFPHLSIGIGIHTGEVIVGNVGSAKRFDYTILGDNVNLASRIEGLTKQYGIPILLTEPTIKNLKIENVIFRLIDEVIVKGKSKPIKIFQPLIKNKLNIELKNNFEAAFKSYQKKEFDAAKKQFEKIENDDPSKLMLKRIELVRKKSNFDGIWKWDKK